MTREELGNLGTSPALQRALKLSERIAREIVAEVGRLGLQEGDRLPSEAEMMEAYGVGRASLREALRLLESQSLIRIRPGHGGGAFVAASTGESFGRMTSLHLQFRGVKMRELVRARLQLEPMLAAEAAKNRTAKTAARLEAALAREEERPASSDEYAEVLRAPNSVHAEIALSSGNRVMALYSMALHEIMFERVLGTVIPTNERQRVVDDHREAVEAIIEGDAAAAFVIWTRHMEHYARAAERRHKGLLDEVVVWR